MLLVIIAVLYYSYESKQVPVFLTVKATKQCLPCDARSAKRDIAIVSRLSVHP